MNAVLGNGVVKDLVGESLGSPIGTAGSEEVSAEEESEAREGEGIRRRGTTTYVADMLSNPTANPISIS